MKKIYAKLNMHHLIGLGIAVLMVSLDQITKALARSFIPNQFDSFNETPIKIIPNFFHLIEHHNYGVAWSQFENNFFILYLVPIIALLAFGYFAIKANFQTKKFYSTGIFLAIAGTLGNFIDRLIFGYVVDFIQFIFGSYTYPTFNVADMCLVVGIIMLAIDIIFLESKRDEAVSIKDHDEALGESDAL